MRRSGAAGYPRVVRALHYVAVAALVVGSLLFGPAARAAVPECPDDLEPWRATLGAEWIACVRLADLTVSGGNPYTDPNSLTGMGNPPPSGGTLHSKYTSPITGVPGIQIHGYFPDGCNAFQVEPALTAKNGAPFIKGCEPPDPPPYATCLAACHHNGQFVLRIPDTWSGRLLTAGTPGIRDAFSSDAILSDFALSRGWAYVSQDKGNMGANFFQAGCDERGTCASEASWPGACRAASTPWCAAVAVEEWTFRMRQATRAARALLNAVAPAYGLTKVVRSYAAGISNGGYQVRRALETDKAPDRLYDGGVDWEGTLFLSSLPRGLVVHDATGNVTADPVGFNLFTYLPTALANWPGDVSGDPAARAALERVGFDVEAEPLWPYHWAIYWGLTQKIYRLAFDPEYTAYTCSEPEALAVGPPCVSPPVLDVPPTDVDARYDYTARLIANAALRGRLDAVANTGDIQRPLITLHGDNDALLPYRTDSDLYQQLVALKHRSSRHRSYVVRGGNHVDPQFDEHWDRGTPYGRNVIRPMLPCVRAAIDALVEWVERDSPPPPSRTIARTGTTAAALANSCGLAD